MAIENLPLVPPNFQARSQISTVGTTNREIVIHGPGVAWEELAKITDSGGHFVEIVYQPGAQSNPNGALVAHEGFEYGYALEGDLEMTIGDFVFTLSQSHSFGFDASIPHGFKNKGNVDFRGVWFVHDCEGGK